MNHLSAAHNDDDDDDNPVWPKGAVGNLSGCEPVMEEESAWLNNFPFTHAVANVVCMRAVLGGRGRQVFGRLPHASVSAAGEIAAWRVALVYRLLSALIVAFHILGRILQLQHVFIRIVYDVVPDTMKKSNICWKYSTSR